MGNYKFRLSELIPNAWFCKLKQMGNDKSAGNFHHNRQNHQPTEKEKSSPSQTQPFLPITTTRTSRGGHGPETEFSFSLPVQTHHDCLSRPRKSYYFTRELKPKTVLESPDSSDLFFFKSSGQRRLTTKRRSRSFPSPASTPTTTTNAKCLSSASSSLSAANYQNNIVIDVNKNSLGRKTVGSVSGSELPPIRTERKKFSDSVKRIGGTQQAIDETIKQRKSSVNRRGRVTNGSLSGKVLEQESMGSEQWIRPVRRHSTGSPRIRIRIHSPRISRRVQINSSGTNPSSSSSRKIILSKSLVVVKSSFNPLRDFWESVAEMIVENDIRASKDLEDLLACYLSLNSEEFHDIIVKVFRQVWLDLNNIRLEEVK